MAKLPEGYSLQASPIETALSEGRTEDAKTLIYEVLMSGRADEVVQRLAAAMIKPATKSRGRQKALPHHWFDIGTEFHSLRSSSVNYEDALRFVADRFGYSETHCRKAIREFEEAKAEHDKANRE